VDDSKDNTAAAGALPEPPWLRSRRRTPPRAPLTREAIVEAAVGLLDREGLDAVSMRGVSEELGAGPASLYWHVSNKEELLDLVYDRITGEVELPVEVSPWQEQIKEFARAWRRVLSAHRDVARITLARIPTGPNAMVRMDWLLGVLRSAGMSDEAVAMASDAATLYINAFCYEEAIPFRAVGTTAEISESAEMLEGYFASLPAERFPNFAALGSLLTMGTFDERFEFGLDMIVRGLETYVRPKRAKRRAKRS
jgi:AcrR family transcriptional regulator